MASRNQCIPFCKHCDFLEGIACLRHGMAFPGAAAVLQSSSLQFVPKLGAVGNLTVIN